MICGILKRLFFCFENYEICFAKQDCWFSQEIEIYREIIDRKDILSDFDSDESKSICVKRNYVEIKLY